MQVPGQARRDRPDRRRLCRRAEMTLDHTTSRQRHHGAGHRGRDRRIRRARDRPQRPFFGETAEGWGMNFAAQSTKSCCFSTVPLLLDWLQDIVHRRYDRISRILKRGVDVVEVFPHSHAADSQRYGSEKSFRRWHIASFRCDAEFDRYRGIADMAGPTTGSTRQRMTQR